MIFKKLLKTFSSFYYLTTKYNIFYVTYGYQTNYIDQKSVTCKQNYKIKRLSH